MSTHYFEAAPDENPFSESSDKNVYEATVLRIFELAEELDTGHQIFDDTRRNALLNAVYMPYELTASFEEQAFWTNWPRIFPHESPQEMEQRWERNQQAKWYQSTTFLLNDGRDMAAFRRVAAEILPLGIEVWDYSDFAFPQMLGAMANMNDLAGLILWGAIGAISLVIIGNHLAAGLSQTLLQNDLAEQPQTLYQELFTQITINYSGNAFSFHNPGDMSLDEMLAAYDVSLGLGTAATIFAVGLGVIILATSVASLYIWLLPPKDILVSVS